jgi:hypothetical protein
VSCNARLLDGGLDLASVSIRLMAVSASFWYLVASEFSCLDWSGVALDILGATDDSFLMLFSHVSRSSSNADAILLLLLYRI